MADLDAAIVAANASAFGLGASIFTTSLHEAMEAVERREAGNVWVNNPLIDNDALPFGGWKASGLWRELGRQGVDALRRTKMVVIDLNPVRQGWWYPYRSDRLLDAGRPEARLIRRRPDDQSRGMPPPGGRSCRPGSAQWRRGFAALVG